MSNNSNLSPDDINAVLEQISSGDKIEKSSDNLKLMFSLIDLTSLNTQDTGMNIKEICQKVNGFADCFPGVPNVGAICVYPSLVHIVHETLQVPGVGIASVAACFPSSQSFLAVKELECEMAIKAGATEIDVVISVGRYLENDMEYISNEISSIKRITGPAKLKVILETGLLPVPSDVYRASMASLQAGADFIKTSTGKVQPAATPQAVLMMCYAIKDFFEESGKKAGIKPAGGISTADQALHYAGIIRSVLGDDWLDPSLFRIGASRLANHILSEIILVETGKTEEVGYF